MIWKRIAVLVLFALLIALQFSRHENATARELPRTVTVTGTVQVGPNGSTQFAPAVLNLSPGDSVNWVWSNPILPHSTTSGTCSGTICTSDGNWESMQRTAPSEFMHTFPVAGTFPYFCSVHLSFMQGKIIVASNHLFLPLIAK